MINQAVDRIGVWYYPPMIELIGGRCHSIFACDLSSVAKSFHRCAQTHPRGAADKAWNDTTRLMTDPGRGESAFCSR